MGVMRFIVERIRRVRPARHDLATSEQPQAWMTGPPGWWRFLPPGFFRVVRDGFLAADRGTKAEAVTRTD